MMFRLLVLLLLVCLGVAPCYGFLAKTYKRQPAANSHSVTEYWFQQRLDHFTGADTRVWQQRYFVNDTYMQSGGPVFLMIGGEGPANPAWMNSGAWLSYAEKLGALCLMLEHRFYGKSHPTPDMSTDSLRYLSSQQALADIAHFQTVMKEKLGLADSKWVAFGGSYPGSLAAWYRMKYPHLAHMAVASSAPVKAQVNFSEYLEVVQLALALNHSDCPEAIKLASEEVSKLLEVSSFQMLTDDFRLCDLLQINSWMDAAYLLDTLAENIMDVVQYNKDNREFEGVKDTNITIPVVCDIMANNSLGTPYHRYATVIRTILEANGEKCIDASYKKFIQDMSNITWAPLALGGRQWMYQTCTEFGFFQSTDSAAQPFSGIPLSYHVQQCSDIFGPEYNLSMVTDAVQQTNEYYGGLDIKGSRIVFSNGLIDPWHRLGINADVSGDLIAIQMDGAAHCANMYPARSEDPPSVHKARQYIFQLLTKWLYT
ncbi:putative serine protease K12H4.7 isoform X1 [Xenopus laevis]|uniref:Serine protease K12H4.7 isoform X1 n=3 Tax=Xenopus laevis TaxID=8355 RepID=A0A1L8GB21_XENLA|nr:putative serine protease K12H4.7 isoform X1 [Xenopus laevis]OCT80961.1 hypothetical protein XELAEV_18027773mg [Xenopus laevis]